MAIWPDTLPQYPQQGSFTRSPLTEVVETAMSTGYKKRRKRYTRTYYSSSLVYEMTLDQLDIFEEFFEDVLGYGVVNMTIPNPMLSPETIDVQINTENSYNVSPWETSYDSVIVSFDIIS